MPYLVSVATMVAIQAVAALGLNLQFGVAGLFNVGCTAFIAAGAYASAIVTGPRFALGLGGFGLPLPVGLAAGAGVGALLALGLGAGLLRLRGDVLAIATFGLAAAAQVAVTNLEGLTGGANGLSGVTLRLGPGGSNLAWLGVCGGCCGAVWLALWWLDRGPWGRILRAVSDDPEAADALGRNPAAFRRQAFVGGGACMGLSGALLAHNAGFVSPQDFPPVLTFQLYAMVIIGGAGRHAGAVLGAAAVWVVWSVSGQVLAALLPPQAQAVSGALRLAAIALALIGVLLFRPEGLLAERVGRR